MKFVGPSRPILVLIAVSLLPASVFIGQGTEIIGQEMTVNTFAVIWPVPMFSPLDQHNNSRQSQEVGNRSLQSVSEANSDTITVDSESSLTLHHTNTPASDIFWMESTLSMQSRGDAPGRQDVVTRAMASANVSFQVRSDVPFHFRIVTSSESPGVAPVLGALSIRMPNFQPIAQFNWFSSANETQESQGNLPPGVYQIEFSTRGEVEGAIASFLQSPIAFGVRTTAALTITPQEPAVRPRAALHLRRRGDDVLLEMTRLQPGTFYFIERTGEISSDFWSYATNFTAGGTNAVWIETLNPPAQKVFYRLRY